MRSINLWFVSRAHLLTRIYSSYGYLELFVPNFGTFFPRQDLLSSKFRRFTRLSRVRDASTREINYRVPMEFAIKIKPFNSFPFTMLSRILTKRLVSPCFGLSNVFVVCESLNGPITSLTFGHYFHIGGSLLTSWPNDNVHFKVYAKKIIKLGVELVKTGSRQNICLL